MEASTAAVVLSGLAILISVFGTIRIAKATATIQQWAYRQKVGEELSSLSSLLTQSQLLTRRGQQRNDAAEVEAKRLHSESPTDVRIKAELDSFSRSRSILTEHVEVHAEIRRVMEVIWCSKKPTADQLASIQRMKASVQNELAQLQELEPLSEEKFKAFIESAGQEARTKGTEAIK